MADFWAAIDPSTQVVTGLFVREALQATLVHDAAYRTQCENRGKTAEAERAAARADRGAGAQEAQAAFDAARAAAEAIEDPEAREAAERAARTAYGAALDALTATHDRVVAEINRKLTRDLETLTEATIQGKVGAAVPVDRATWERLRGVAGRWVRDAAGDFVAYAPPPETPEKQAVREKREAAARIRGGDRALGEDTEALLEALLAKGTLAPGDIPPALAQKLAQRRTDRAALAPKGR